MEEDGVEVENTEDTLIKEVPTMVYPTMGPPCPNSSATCSRTTWGKKS